MEKGFEVFDLTGRTAIVTGGSRGIGFAIAKGLASAGASIILGDILIDQGEEAAKAIRSGGSEARFMEVDVTRRDSVQEMVSKALNEF